MSRGTISPRIALTGRWLAALGLALLFQMKLPLAGSDPFRGTLVLLPLVLLGFRELARRTSLRGGGKLRRRDSVGEGIALGSLLLLVWTRHSLGLSPLADLFLAAGFALVLAHRVGVQLLALRPLLGRRLPLIPSAGFFWLPFLVYVAILPWSSYQHPPDGDEPYYLLMTHSLAYDLDVDLTNNYQEDTWRFFMTHPLEPQPGDPVGSHGELYSRHNALLPLVLAPFYRLAGKLGALVAMAALAAALAWMTLKLGRRYYPERPGEAFLAYALVAFCPPLLLYSYQVWVEVPAALLAAVALDQIRTLNGHGSWGRRQWLGIGVPVLLLPLVKIRFMLLAGPLVALAWWHAGRPKKPLVILAVLLVVVGGGILVHNQVVYDNPLKIHHLEELKLYDYSVGDYLEGSFGLFFDSAFGLFGCAPLWLILVPALPLLVRQREPVLRDLLLLSVAYLVVVVPRAEWYGGWSPPFRYALVALPMLGLATVPALRARRLPGARALLAGLGLLTLALTLLWVTVPGWTYNFADGRTDLLDHLSRLLGSDLARLLPSSVRPRPATWLVPLAAALLLPWIWWLPRRRRASRPPRPFAWEGASLGVTGLLLVAATLPFAAARLPTREVEMEDAQVSHAQGHLYPDPWVIERTRFRGGWVIRSGEHIDAPVVPGGERVRLRLSVQLIRNREGDLPIEVAAGDLPLGRWTLRREDDRRWRVLTTEAAPWPPGARLTVRVPGAADPPPPNGVIVDKVELFWESSSSGVP